MVSDLDRLWNLLWGLGEELRLRELPFCRPLSSLKLKISSLPTFLLLLEEVTESLDRCVGRVFKTSGSQVTPLEVREGAELIRFKMGEAEDGLPTLDGGGVKSLDKVGLEEEGGGVKKDPSILGGVLRLDMSEIAVKCSDDKEPTLLMIDF